MPIFGVVLGLALAGCAGQNTTGSEASDAPSGDAGITTFDGKWVFTKPKGLIPQEFTICAAGCFTLLGKQSNLAKDLDGVTVSEDRVIVDPALMSIRCTGGGGMSHTFRLELVSQGPDRLIANDVALPGGGCDGLGPASVDFVAERVG